ncbi:hypothetical protein [Streptomyces sp. NPDC003036]|uniref:hypothetical protein n=1 Tax=Streptomyces sp. NPDC003036 TaxID=3154442 RepID=UPI0033BE00D5
MSSIRDAVPRTVVMDLTTAGYLTADIAQAFRMADALFSEARLSCQRFQLTDHYSVGTWDYWYRRIRESARFREHTAVIYLDTVFGYGIAIRRLLCALRTGKAIRPDLVQRAMEEGASIPVAEELVSEFAGPYTGRGPVVRCLQQSYEVARGSVLTALEAARHANAPTLHGLLADSCTDAGEAVTSCLIPVNRYAEALHFALCQDDVPHLPAVAGLEGTG